MQQWQTPRNCMEACKAYLYMTKWRGSLISEEGNEGHNDFLYCSVLFYCMTMKDVFDIHPIWHHESVNMMCLHKGQSFLQISVMWLVWRTGRQKKKLNTPSNCSKGFLICFKQQIFRSSINSRKTKIWEQSASFGTCDSYTAPISISVTKNSKVPGRAPFWWRLHISCWESLPLHCHQDESLQKYRQLYVFSKLIGQ